LNLPQFGRRFGGCNSIALPEIIRALPGVTGIAGQREWRSCCEGVFSATEDESLRGELGMCLLTGVADLVGLGLWRQCERAFLLPRSSFFVGLVALLRCCARRNHLFFLVVHLLYFPENPNQHCEKSRSKCQQATHAHEPWPPSTTATNAQANAPASHNSCHNGIREACRSLACMHLTTWPVGLWLDTPHSLLPTHDTRPSKQARRLKK
jgi:hypothetical protein